MYAYESALLGFLGLYPLKVSLVWIIASLSGYSKPSPGYCSWNYGISSLTNSLHSSNLNVPIWYLLLFLWDKIQILKLLNIYIFTLHFDIEGVTLIRYWDSILGLLKKVLIFIWVLRNLLTYFYAFFFSNYAIR